MTQEARRAMLQGKNKILLFRKLKDSNKEAAKLVFQTEHTFSLSREMDKIPTKDGTLVKIGELEGEFTGIEAIQSKGDPVVTMLQEAVIDGEKLEVWEVTVDDNLKNEDGQYPAIYAQGYLNEWELPANAEEEARVSSNLQIELIPQFGYATLTEEQEEAVQYAFKDTVAEQPAGV